MHHISILPASCEEGQEAYVATRILGVRSHSCLLMKHDRTVLQKQKTDPVLDPCLRVIGPTMDRSSLT